MDTAKFLLALILVRTPLGTPRVDSGHIHAASAANIASIFAGNDAGFTPHCNHRCDARFELQSFRCGGVAVNAICKAIHHRGNRLTDILERRQRLFGSLIINQGFGQLFRVCLDAPAQIFLYLGEVLVVLNQMLNRHLSDSALKEFVLHSRPP